MNLTPADLAARLRLQPKTLENWRVLGKGPKFWKPSARKVLYRLLDVEAWEAERGNIRAA